MCLNLGGRRRAALTNIPTEGGMPQACVDSLVHSSRAGAGGPGGDRVCVQGAPAPAWLVDRAWTGRAPAPAEGRATGGALRWGLGPGQGLESPALGESAEIRGSRALFGECHGPSRSPPSGAEGFSSGLLGVEPALTAPILVNRLAADQTREAKKEGHDHSPRRMGDSEWSRPCSLLRTKRG